MSAVSSVNYKYMRSCFIVITMLRLERESWCVHTQPWSLPLEHPVLSALLSENALLISKVNVLNGFSGDVTTFFSLLLKMVCLLHLKGLQSHSGGSIQTLKYIYLSQVFFFFFEWSKGEEISILKRTDVLSTRWKHQHLTTSSRDGALRLNFVVKKWKSLCGSGMWKKKKKEMRFESSDTKRRHAQHFPGFLISVTAADAHVTIWKFTRKKKETTLPKKKKVFCASEMYQSKLINFI